VLAQGKGGYCAFWKKGLCGIHPVKPKMCRDWPFIGSVIVDPGNWYAMARSCPGMRTDVSEEEILRCVKHELKKNGRR
jgi:Fe-S-cluster containining protein